MKFIQTDGHKRSKLKKVWRKPRGLQNKMRLKKKGYRVCVDVGYKTPVATRGMIKNLVPVNVKCLADLKGFDSKTCGVLISAKLGDAKRIKIIDEAKKANLTLLNIKDSESIKKRFEEKQAKQKQKIDTRKKSKAAKPESKKLEDKLESKEDSKKSNNEIEKKEQQKILTKRDQQ